MIKAEIEFNAGAQKRRESYSVTLHTPGAKITKGRVDRSGGDGGGKNSSRLERNISLINVHISPRGDFMKH